MDDGTTATPYVLLLEDDTATRSLVRDILQDELGVEVAEAMDGLKALDLLASRDTPPALLVVDLMLPNMDGETFMHEVRRRYGANLPIIVMSAMDPKLVRSSAEQVGAKGVVLKPFNVADFIGEVSDALDLARPDPAPLIDLESVRRLKRARFAG